MSASSRWWSGEYGSITPSWSERGATAAATRASGRGRASTIGRAAEPSSSSSTGPSSTSSRAAARSGAISAKGLSSRCLRERRRGDGRLVVGAARQVEAADALDRHDRAADQRLRGGRHRVGRCRPRRSRTRGPHSGQALGWAWKRRLAGSRYSARQAGHIWKPAMVVFGRSYGTSRTIVKRGPQFVQLTKG